MATRFYLPGSASVPPVDPSPGAIWDVTTGYDTRSTDTVKSNTAITTAARAKGSTVAWDDRLDVVFVSARQLAAQTISAGTFSMVARAVESATTGDFYLQTRIKVVSPDGSVERGDLFSGETLTAVVATVGARNEEFGTTSATRIKNAIATSAVTAQQGDRIVISVGARGGGTTSATTFNLRFGDPTATADFALTSGLTTDLCPWVELSNTLVWSVPTLLPPSSYRRLLPQLVR